jgi:signal transduction histidine kinase/ligand-binding sensor domain-containing protein/CheY-like chemotaxis protein
MLIWNEAIPRKTRRFHVAHAWSLCLLLFCSSALAQEKVLRFQHIDAEDSFASQSIISSTQDQQGFMWFASISGGFARFDGYEFKIYQHAPEDPDSLPTNEVHSLFADPNGGIWAGTADGLVWLDTARELLSVYRHDPENPSSLSHSNIGPIIRDAHAVLWVGTIDGLNRLDAESGKFVRYPLKIDDPDPENFLPVNWVWCLFEDSNQNLWVGTLGGGLLRYDRVGDRFNRTLHDPNNPASLPGNVIRSITEDHEGNIWVGTDKGLARLLDESANRFEVFNTRSMFEDRNLLDVDAMLEDRSGNLWASLGEAIIVRPAGSEAFEFFEHDPADPGSIGDGRIWSIYEDRSGVIWFTSNRISRLVPSVHAFSVFPLDAEAGHFEFLSYDGHDHLRVGGKEGLHEFSLAAKQWTTYRLFPDAANNKQNWIHGSEILEEHDRRLLVATADRLNRFDPNTGVVETVDLPVEPNAMDIGSDGLVWMALPFTGLASLDFETEELQIFGPDTSNPDSVSDDFGYAVLEDEQGRLWYGTLHGLNLFERSTGTAKKYLREPGNEASLSDNTVRRLFEDNHGRLWVGTQFGLNLFLEGGNGFKRYFNGSQAQDNFINSITSFGDEILWLATDRGIARFDMAAGDFRNYSYSDGLPANFQPALRAGENGILYGLTSKGILRIDTNLLDQKSEPPAIAFTGFRLFNEPVQVYSDGARSPLNVSIDNAQSLILDHSHQVVSFEFSALDYYDPEQNQYQYTLEGLNDRWIDTDAKNRIATFTGLIEGDYTLRIRGANRFGTWNESGVSLDITVLPPPWRTGWAYTLYALLSIALFASFIRWRTRLLRIRSSELEQAVDERTRQLQESEQTILNQSKDLEDLLEIKERLFINISHEFRTPLTLMLGPIDSALSASRHPEMTARLEMARRNGKRVLRLVDQLLELSRISSDEQLNLMPQPIKPLVEVVVEAFRPFARNKGIALTALTDDRLWVKCDPEAIERILMNLVSNALKFTSSGGRVNVVLREHETSTAGGGQVELQVFDTGKGIPKDQQDSIFKRFKRADDSGEAIAGSGIGLALVKELTEAHGGSITLESEPGKGTLVNVLLPLYRPEPGVSLVSDKAASDALQLEVDVLEQPEHVLGGSSGKGDSDQPKILVIEDNKDMQYYLHELLSPHYSVELAVNGEDGLSIAQETIPDLIICDIMLPIKDGFQVSHELKSDHKTSHIPIIILTARGDEDSRLTGLREHVDDYVTKPFNEEELMLRVGNLLAVRDILKARYSGELIIGKDPRYNLNETERQFLDQLDNVLDCHYSDEHFSVVEMASGMAMSVRQLQRKLKALTDQQPVNYLRLYRLHSSLELLKKGKRVGDVAFAVGFGSPTYFSSCFRAQFGQTPTEFQKDASITEAN